MASSYAARCSAGSRPPIRKALVASASARNRLALMPWTRISCWVSAAAVRLACQASASWSAVSAPKTRHTTIASSRSRARLVGTCLARPRAASSSLSVPRVASGGGGAAAGGRRGRGGRGRRRGRSTLRGLAHDVASSVGALQSVPLRRLGGGWLVEDRSRRERRGRVDDERALGGIEGFAAVVVHEVLGHQRAQLLDGGLVDLAQPPGVLADRGLEHVARVAAVAEGRSAAHASRASRGTASPPRR